jgi:hypothetical protein
MSKVRLLRCHWAAFALLITLGLISELLFMPYSSPWQLCQAHPRRYAFFAGHAVFFWLSLSATYLNRKLLWGLAIAFISRKLYHLLKYYAFFNYLESSNIYTHDYWVFFYRVYKLSSYWLAMPGDMLFSNNPVSAAFLTTLYVYWLVECWKLLRAKPKEASLPALGHKKAPH